MVKTKTTCSGEIIYLQLAISNNYLKFSLIEILIIFSIALFLQTFVYGTYVLDQAASAIQIVEAPVAAIALSRAHLLNTYVVCFICYVLLKELFFDISMNFIQNLKFYDQFCFM